MRVVIASLLLLMAACDRAQPAAADKANPAAADKPNPAASQATPAVDRSYAGTAAPAVTFEAPGGAKHRIADFRGTAVLVNLWATWCAPCKAEMPDLDRLAKARGTRLKVVALSQDMAGWQAVDGFFTPGRFAALTPYLDQPSAFALAVDARGLPMSILYDEQGREVWRVNGPLAWDSAAVARLIG